LPVMASGEGGGNTPRGSELNGQRMDLSAIQIEGEVVKRIRMLMLLGAVAVVLPLGVLGGVAKATGGGGGAGSNQVTIDQYAHYTTQNLLQVGLNVRCQGGVQGLVAVQVDQYPPETPFPVSFGSGTQPVVCDGKTHSVGVSYTGFGYDAGKAKATATLTAPSGNVTVERWIIITVEEP
jgi:hypothetical protein